MSSQEYRARGPANAGVDLAGLVVHVCLSLCLFKGDLFSSQKVYSAKFFSAGPLENFAEFEENEGEKISRNFGLEESAFQGDRLRIAGLPLELQWGIEGGGCLLARPVRWTDGGVRGGRRSVGCAGRSLRGQTVYHDGNVRSGAVCAAMWPGCRWRVNGRSRGLLYRGDDGTGEAAAGGASRRRWRHRRRSRASSAGLLLGGAGTAGCWSPGENGAVGVCPLVNECWRPGAFCLGTYKRGGIQ